jgi:uncharacterized protein YdeI (YjbR/CyaY-like superfamily)
VSERHPHLEVTDRAHLRDWLAAHHRESPGVWAVTYKKAAAPAGAYVAYEEVVEEALCFGWIDSVRRSVDGARSRLLLSPRKRGSGWSRVNKERIERLRADGRLQPAGEAAITAAVADGSWARRPQTRAARVAETAAAAARGERANQWRPKGG